MVISMKLLNKAVNISGLILASVMTVGTVASSFSIPTATAAPKDLACNNNNFKSSTGGGFLSNSPFIRTDKTPNNYSAFKPDAYYPGNGQAWGKPRFKYIARFNNIKEWRGKVCAKSVQNSANNHIISYQSSNNSSCPTGGNKYCKMYVGPTISFEVKGRNEAENKWRPIKKNGNSAVYEIPANQTKVYNWAWKRTKASDFRIVVRYAKPVDEFDFLMDKK